MHGVPPTSESDQIGPTLYFINGASNGQQGVRTRLYQQSKNIEYLYHEQLGNKHSLIIIQERASVSFARQPSKQIIQKKNQAMMQYRDAVLRKTNGGGGG